ILVPFIIVLPGVIGFYYFKDGLYGDQDMIYPELIKKVLPLSLVGFFAAVVMGAVLSTFNSVLNSTATIFSAGIYKRILHKSASEKQMVMAGKWSSVVLAIFAIMAAPAVAGAPDGLYQLLQQLNGIFFIPIASVMLAGFYIPQVSATGAKAALVVGLSFYIITTFILDVDLHFVHIWGIEFLLNLAVMLVVSKYYPNTNPFKPKDMGAVKLEHWRYAKPLGIVLVIVVIAIYIWLGQ
ncbi:MAG: sodium:solute symporter family transporter, partial [Cyclobacteriaceae bacterium]